MELSVVLVTSPFPSMPSLVLVNTVLDSLSHVKGLEAHLVHKFIIMDGYKESTESRLKKGRVSSEQARLYDDYYDALLQKFSSDEQCTVLRSDTHRGFAMMVKWGLELCRTTYALILQHDRYFRRDVHDLSRLLIAMEEHEHIRYIGFPTGNSVSHDTLLHSGLHLGYLNDTERIHLSSSMSLQPLLFWFDSQHLAHVARYLQIFTPRIAMDTYNQRVSSSVPSTPVIDLELLTIKKLLLRTGDFIEDRFGQEQRKLFVQWRDEKRSPEQIRSLFRFFGSYLCWQPKDTTNESQGADEAEGDEEGIDTQGGSMEGVASGQRGAQLLVSHLHGRTLDLQFLRHIAEKHGLNAASSGQHRAFLARQASEATEDNGRRHGTSIHTPTSTRKEKSEDLQYDQEHPQPAKDPKSKVLVPLSVSSVKFETRREVCSGCAFCGRLT